MRCMSCQQFSFSILCKKCQETLFTPNLYKKELAKNFFVYSFYNYEEIEELIQSKYYFHGDRVYKILAELSFKKFAQTFTYAKTIQAIPIDDHTLHDFSQTALLTKYLKSKFITPKYNQLKATNRVKYAGKNLKFREQNPRKFVYHGLPHQEVILVDDLITTGTTLLEARKTLLKSKVTPLFALTLSTFIQ